MTREEAIKVVKERLDYYEREKRLKAACEVLIPELKESEDERIKNIITDSVFYQYGAGDEYKDVLDYLDKLEKQKENIEKEYVFRPLAGTDITVAAKQAIRRVKEGDRLVLAFNGAYIPVRKGNNAKEIVDIYNAFIEKQKDTSKAIETVDRIDKYIDENVANAHDMKDSNPDKKYYRGWDDALGEMAGILQDVYSKKENKFAPRVLPCSAAWFEDGDEKQKGQKPEEKPINWTELTWKDINELEGIINNVHYEFRNGIGQESFGKEVLEKFREYKGDEYLDEAEQKYWRENEPKPAEWSYPYGRNETADRLVSLAECLEMDGDCLFNEYSGTECGKFLRELARKQIECKPTWSEEDEEMINTLVSYVEDPSCWNLKCPREKLVAFIKSLPKRFSPHPKQEWSEEDEKSFNNALSGLKYAYEDLINHKSFDSAEDVKNAFDWLKFLRP